MCWEMDYHWFAEQQKAQEKAREKQKQAQRTDAIDKLLTQVNEETGKADDTPVKETVATK